MWRHVVAQAARCACPAIRGGLPELNDCSNQIINLFLLAHDDAVKLLQQVFGVGGFDFQISQALINVVGVVREIHERIGHEFENAHLVCAEWRLQLHKIIHALNPFYFSSGKLCA